MTVQDKLQRRGPRRLLALDGGGVRGVLTIEVLAEIERMLQQALGRDDSFTLAEYFDYVGGTSTGAIIATCLSLGMRVARIRELYHECARQMLVRSGIRHRFQYKYVATYLDTLLERELGRETTLGSDRLQTLLLLVLRNASTDSAWPLSNNPLAKYNSGEAGTSNLTLPLWQLVRASCAAPTYFPPEVIKSDGQQFVFVDGGVTVYNNPAFLLFLMATVEPYRLCWPASRDAMLLVSVGTGHTPSANENLRPQEMNLLFNAASVPSALISSAMQEQDFLCRTFGECLVGDEVDSEVGTMRGARGPIPAKLFTYLRYNADLSRAGLDRLGLTDIDPRTVQPLDAVEHLDHLQRIGRRVATQVKLPDFGGFVT